MNRCSANQDHLVDANKLAQESHEAIADLLLSTLRVIDPEADPHAEDLWADLHCEVESLIRQHRLLLGLLRECEVKFEAYKREGFKAAPINLMRRIGEVLAPRRAPNPAGQSAGEARSTAPALLGENNTCA